MNKVKINVVRIFALIALGFLIKGIFQEDLYLNVYERLLLKLIFLGVPMYFLVTYWSKAETMYDEYRRELRKEELELSNSELGKNKNKPIYIEKQSSSITRTIMLIAAIATIIGTLIGILK